MCIAQFILTRNVEDAIPYKFNKLTSNARPYGIIHTKKPPFTDGFDFIYIVISLTTESSAE